MEDTLDSHHERLEANLVALSRFDGLENDLMAEHGNLRSQFIAYREAIELTSSESLKHAHLQHHSEMTKRLHKLLLEAKAVARRRATQMTREELFSMSQERQNALKPKSAEDRVGEEVTKSLKRMLETMKTEVDRSVSNISTARATSNTLSATSDNYRQMSSTLQESRSLIRDLWRRDRRDRLYVLGAIGFFLASVFFILIQRMPGVVWLPGKLVWRGGLRLVRQANYFYENHGQGIYEDFRSKIDKVSDYVFIPAQEENVGSSSEINENPTRTTEIDDEKSDASQESTDSSVDQDQVPEAEVAIGDEIAVATTHDNDAVEVINIPEETKESQAIISVTPEELPTAATEAIQSNESIVEYSTIPVSALKTPEAKELVMTETETMVFAEEDTKATLSSPDDAKVMLASPEEDNKVITMPPDDAKVMLASPEEDNKVITMSPDDTKVITMPPDDTKVITMPPEDATVVTPVIDDPNTTESMVDSVVTATVIEAQDPSATAAATLAVNDFDAPTAEARVLDRLEVASSYEPSSESTEDLGTEADSDESTVARDEL